MPPQLSSGTLGLKFMQRGQQPSSSSPKPPTPAAPEPGVNGWQTAGKKGKGKQKAEEDVEVKTEDNGIFGSEKRAKGKERAKASQVVYETSYASFPILSTRYAVAPVATVEAGPSGLPMHAGRKSFGKFNEDVERLGQAPKPTEEAKERPERDDDRMMSGRDPRRGNDKKSRLDQDRRPKPSPSSAKPTPPADREPQFKAAPAPPPAPKGFMRPAGFIEPTRAKSQPPKKRPREEPPAAELSGAAKKPRPGRPTAAELDSSESGEVSESESSDEASDEESSSGDDDDAVAAMVGVKSTM